MSPRSTRRTAGAASALALSMVAASPAAADAIITIDDAPASVVAGSTATIAVSGCEATGNGGRIGLSLKYDSGRVETFAHYDSERPWTFVWEVPRDASGPVRVEASCFETTVDGITPLGADEREVEITLSPSSAPTAAPETPEPQATATAEPAATAPATVASAATATATAEPQAPSPTPAPEETEPAPADAEAPMPTEEPERPAGSPDSAGDASLSLTAIAPLRPLTVTGEGFTPRETVEVWFGAGTAPLNAVTAGVDGVVSGIFIVPANTAPGVYTVELVGTSSSQRLTAELTVVSTR